MRREPTTVTDNARLDSLMRELARTPEVQSTPSHVQPGDRIGRFAILGLVGEGGFGRVYRARDTQLGRHVALELLQLPTQGHVELFRREAETAAQLHHPGIVTLHDYGETDEGTPFLVLELLAGETLGERLERGVRPRPPSSWTS